MVNNKIKWTFLITAFHSINLVITETLLGTFQHALALIGLITAKSAYVIDLKYGNWQGQTLGEEAIAKAHSGLNTAVQLNAWMLIAAGLIVFMWIWRLSRIWMIARPATLFFSHKSQRIRWLKLLF